MPRAFDRGVPPLDKNPLQSATSWDDPQGIIGEAASLYGEFLKQWVTTLLEDGVANVFKDCTGGFIEGLRQLGAGETDLARIGDGLNNFIDTLVATLLCKAEGAVTPQDLLSTVGNIFDLLGASPIVQQLQALVESSGSGLEDALGGAFTVLSSLLGDFTIEGFLMPLLAWVQWLWDQFGDVSETFLKPVLNLLKSVWDAFTTAAVAAGSTATVWLSDLFDFLGWVWENFGPVVETFLKPVATLIKTIWDTFAAAALGTGQTATSLLTELFTFLSWLWNGVAGGFAGFGSTVDTVLKPLIEFLNWLWALFSTTAIGSMETLKSIFTELSKVLDANGALTTWIGNIPLIGPLVKYLTANIPNIDFTPDLAGLGQWANQLLHLDSSLPAGNLIGDIPEAMLSMIPVANINISSANLLGQGSFATASTVDAANGWEWDSTTNDPSGQSSGSAKLTTDGTARYLYARQAIKVAAGDKITLSARIKTASYTGTGTSIVLSVIPYAGTSAQTEKTFDTRGASNGAWATMTGTATDVDPYVVPAGVTSLIVKIGVTSASGSGSTLWVDNVDLRKEGLLGQNLVEYLLNAWEDMWHGLVGTSGSGKTWADMFYAANFLRAFANGTDLDLSTLSGNLWSAPAEVLGSIFGVKFDANNKTVADFLKLLYNALNKSSSTTPKSADDVATAAGAARDQADLGVLNANTAMGDAAQAATDASDALAAANGASGSITNLHTSLLTGYTVVTVNSTTTWTKPSNLSELYVVLMGAGANGSTGSTNTSSDPGHILGGAGGTQGRFVATQIDLALVSALSTVTVTVGTPASPTTSFGSLVNSAAAYANYVATPLGLMSSASLPGNGGTGGEHYAGAAYAGTAGETTSTGVAGGSGGDGRSTTISGNFSGYSGSSGGAGALYANLSQSGGSGGGGGGAIHRATGQTGTITGGSGGNGGFPGGGGGGGGAAVSGGTTAIGGPGGSGANGMALIVYKIAKTTA